MTSRSTVGRSSIARRLAVPCLAILLLLVGAGCAGQGADAEEPMVDSSGGSDATAASASPAPSPITTPSATYSPASAAGPAQNVPLPVMPEIAKERSKEGLEAFARHWYALVNYGYETGETEPLRAISGPDCFACNKWYPVVEDGFSGEGWMGGSSLEVISAVSTFVETAEGRHQVVIEATQEDLQYFGASGHLGTTNGRDESAIQMMEASYGETGWIADEVVTIGQ